MYIHPYEYWMGRRRGRVDWPAARLLRRRVAPTCTGLTRATLMGAEYPRRLPHGRRHPPALHHRRAGTGARAVAYAPNSARHVSTGRAPTREALSRVRPRLPWARILGDSGSRVYA